jgi:hypothetical protein
VTVGAKRAEQLSKPNGLESPVGEVAQGKPCFYESTFCRALPYDLPKGHVPLETRVLSLPPLSSRREEWGRWIAAIGGKTVGENGRSY